jgi:hypothetical protein
MKGTLLQVVGFPSEEPRVKSKLPADPLKVLVDELGDVMSPAWRGLVAVLRFWLGVLQGIGTLAGILFGIVLASYLFHTFSFGRLGFFLCYALVAMPTAAGITLGAGALRRLLARRAARAIGAHVRGALGGSMTSMGVPLEVRGLPAPDAQRERA